MMDEALHMKTKSLNSDINTETSQESGHSLTPLVTALQSPMDPSNNNNNTNTFKDSNMAALLQAEGNTAGRGIPSIGMDNNSVGVKMGGVEPGLRMCAGCGEKIVDRFLLHAVDRYWHTACLKCSCCQAPLGEIGSSCFTKAGLILCKNDYIRMFGNGGTCSACRQPIPASELVMRAQTNVYHVKCFTCVTCHSQLVPGDRFSLVNGSLICEHDYPKVLKGHIQIQQRTSHKVC